MKKTIVLGASINSTRFSNKAIKSLVRHGHEVVAIGAKEGMIGDIEINKTLADTSDIHTISVYLNKDNQEVYKDYIINSGVKRVIFNPGAENDELAGLISENGIEVVNNCTIIMLNNSSF